VRAIKLRALSTGDPGTAMVSGPFDVVPVTLKLPPLRASVTRVTFASRRLKCG
jgi:hypothetical protein